MSFQLLPRWQYQLRRGMCPNHRNGFRLLTRRRKAVLPTETGYLSEASKTPSVRLAETNLHQWAAYSDFSGASSSASMS